MVDNWVLIRVTRVIVWLHITCTRVIAISCFLLCILLSTLFVLVHLTL